MTALSSVVSASCTVGYLTAATIGITGGLYSLWARHARRRRRWGWAPISNAPCGNLGGHKR